MPAKKGNVRHFAYASNLNMFLMIKRVGEWVTSRRASAEGWKLMFNVKSPLRARTNS